LVSIRPVQALQGVSSRPSRRLRAPSHIVLAGKCPSRCGPLQPVVRKTLLPVLGRYRPPVTAALGERLARGHHLSRDRSPTVRRRRSIFRVRDRRPRPDVGLPRDHLGRPAGAGIATAIQRRIRTIFSDPREVEIAGLGRRDCGTDPCHGMPQIGQLRPWLMGFCERFFWSRQGSQHQPRGRGALIAPQQFCGATETLAA